MRRTFVGIFTVVALIASSLGIAGAATDQNAPERLFERIDGLPAKPAQMPLGLDQDREVTVALELADEPVGAEQGKALARGKELTKAERAALRAELKQRQDALSDDISAAGGRVLAQWQDAYNGIKVRIAASEVASLATLPGVVGIHGLQQFTPDNADSVPFIGAPSAWNDLVTTGAGVTVAVIDTGVDYTHANLGGSGDPDDFASNDGTVIEPGTFPTAKVVGGFDFVGDDYDASSDEEAKTIPHPDPDPLDCNGHGSHVGGTAAGSGVLSDGTVFSGPYDATTHLNDFLVGPGVAPEALIYAYRVFGCDGSSDVVVDAINRAIIDDVDVINMSLGSIFGGPDDPTAVASDVASAAGIVVVASAGNSGPNGYMVGSPSTAESVISVAALDTIESFPTATIGVGAGIQAINANESPGLPVTGPLRVLMDGGAIALGCEIEEYASVQPGDIVVTLRGVCARVARAEHGQTVGAAAVIMVNSSNSLPPLEGPIPGVTIPFLGTRSTAGAPLVAANGTQVTITDAGVIPNPAFRALAGFSSGGPRSGDSGVKPDVTAPGVSIMSTGVGQGTGGVRISGTSMAAPHTAGVAALVVGANPDWLPAEVKAAIVNTASADAALIVSGSTNPRVAGSGVVQPRLAADAAVRATGPTGSPTLSFGYEPLAGGYSEMLVLTLVNDSASDQSYNLASAFSGSALGSSLSISPASVIVGANSSETVEVTLSLSAAAVAALPAASQAPGAVVTVRGIVTATPAVAGPGVYPLRVPFALVPRGLSDIVDGTPSAYQPGAPSTFTRTVELSNNGIHAGVADVFSWGQADPDDTDGSMDVAAVGVQTLPGPVAGLAEDDRLLVFAVNTHDRWSNASANEYDIVIDVGRDGTVDFFVVGVDLGAVLAGAFDGRFGSFVIAADGSLVDAFFADAPMNGSTALLPAAASSLGLEEGSSDFSYQTVAFSLEGPAIDVANGLGLFDSHAPGLSQGDFIPLGPGDTAVLTQVVNLPQHNTARSLGWLIVTLDDANGTSQAEQLAVGKVKAKP
jgi:minor extracellular serine protease Vpr